MMNHLLSNAGAAVSKFASYENLVEQLYLPAILESFQRLKAVPGIKDCTENTIRNYLVFDLENKNALLRPYLENKIVKLTKENTILLSPTDTKRTDFEFFISGAGDFVVECKNLSSAEKRYVEEGVIRFVEEFY